MESGFENVQNMGDSLDEYPDAQILSVRRVFHDPVTGEEKRDLFFERLGAESGDSDAMLQLAVAYLEGDGVEQDSEKAAELMTRAAELGNSNAQYSLAVLYAGGTGVCRDFDKVRYWMTCAQENGDTDAAENLELVRDGEALHTAADAGDPEAQARFAKVLMHFRSPKNLSDAFHYATSSAEGGSLLGMFVLGLAYEHGRGTEENMEKAFHWYEKAAMAGYAPAQTNLACLYGRGDGVEQDEETAMQWLRKAAEQHDPDALRILGIDPEEDDEDEETDPDTILAGVEAGDPSAIKEYALSCLMEQEWVRNSTEYAISELEKLGQGGDMEAYMLMALAYERGVGVPQNMNEAVRLYELAAQSGDAAPELALAKVCLYEVNGQPLDIEKCLRYAKSAADKGDPEAAQLYAFVSCTEALKKKGILDGSEDPDTMLKKIQEAATQGDEDAMRLF